jgi:hypothetical protein
MTDSAVSAGLISVDGTIAGVLVVFFLIGVVVGVIVVIAISARRAQPPGI